MGRRQRTRAASRVRSRAVLLSVVVVLRASMTGLLMRLGWGTGRSLPLSAGPTCCARTFLLDRFPSRCKRADIEIPFPDYSHFPSLDICLLCPTLMVKSKQTNRKQTDKQPAPRCDDGSQPRMYKTGLLPEHGFSRSTVPGGRRNEEIETGVSFRKYVCNQYQWTRIRRIETSMPIGLEAIDAEGVGGRYIRVRVKGNKQGKKERSRQDQQKHQYS